MLVAVTPAPPRLGAAGFISHPSFQICYETPISWTKTQPVGVSRKILIMLRVNGQKSYPQSEPYEIFLRTISKSCYAY